MRAATVTVTVTGEWLTNSGEHRRPHLHELFLVEAPVLVRVEHFHHAVGRLLVEAEHFLQDAGYLVRG